MSIISFRQQVAFTALLYVLMLVLVPRAGLQGDVDCWERWATYSFEHGLGNIYQLQNNDYNPFFHYLLWAYSKLLGSTDKIHFYIHWIKAVVLVFDFVGAFWAASLVPERSRRFGLAVLLLLNAGYVYNTLVWVQVDTIYTLFSFGAVVLGIQRRLAGSLVCYVLALAAKTQAVIFLPPLLLLWLPQWWHQPRQLLRALLAGGVTALLVLAPFIWGGWESYLPRILYLNQHAAGRLPYISLNAYNVWYLFAADFEQLIHTDDAMPLAGLTFRQWGLVWFCGASALALLPLLVAAWQALRSRTASSPSMALVMLSCGSIPLLFAFFNTEMHERYWHAAVLFIAAYSFIRRDYLPYILVSVAYFLQLERVLRYLPVFNYSVLLWRPPFIAGLFAVLIVLVVVKIYRLAPWRVASAVAVVPTPALVGA